MVSTAACAGAGGAPGTPASSAAPPGVVITHEGVDANIRNEEHGVGAEMAGSVDAIWAILPAVYEELGLEPSVRQTAQRRFGSTNVSGTRVAGVPMHHLVRCGPQGSGPASLTRFRVVLQIVSTVAPVSESRSTVTTRITGQASRIDGTSTGSVECVSTGRLEEMIAGRLRLLLASGV